MHQCALQTHRFSKLSAVHVFIFTSIQELHSLFSVGLRRLCREDSDFSLKSEGMRDFFAKSGYPASVVQEGHHRTQQIDRQSGLQTSQLKVMKNRIHYILPSQPRSKIHCSTK